MTSQRELAIAAFERRFGARPAVVARAPGRVNLIGEHTDYNDGFVLPMAIEPAVFVAAAVGARSEVTAHSVAHDETVTLSLDAAAPDAPGHWQNYVRGIVDGLRRAGVASPGAILCVSGDLPAGAGLSSSAALCVATARALLALAGTELPPAELVRIVQWAEREFAGTPCGVMDPYVCLAGRQASAVLIDCRALTHEYVPLDLRSHALVLIDSGARRALAAGAYAARVAECRRAAEALGAIAPGVRSLRDADAGLLERCAGRLDAVAMRRAQHVIGENTRVLAAADALRHGRLDELGRLVDEGHRSLRDDFEASCPQVETIIAALRDVPGLLGARMVGGGFGGAVLALAREEAWPALQARFGEGRVRRVRAAAGAETHRLAL